MNGVKFIDPGSTAILRKRPCRAVPDQNGHGVKTVAIRVNAHTKIGEV